MPQPDKSSGESSSDSQCKKKGKIKPKVKDDPKASGGGKLATPMNIGDIHTIAVHDRVSCPSEQWEQLMEYVQ